MANPQSKELKRLKKEHDKTLKALERDFQKIVAKEKSLIEEKQKAHKQQTKTSEKWLKAQQKVKQCQNELAQQQSIFPRKNDKKINKAKDKLFRAKIEALVASAESSKAQTNNTLLDKQLELLKAENTYEKAQYEYKKAKAQYEYEQRVDEKMADKDESDNTQNASVNLAAKKNELEKAEEKMRKDKSSLEESIRKVKYNHEAAVFFAEESKKILKKKTNEELEALKRVMQDEDDPKIADAKQFRSYIEKIDEIISPQVSISYKIPIHSPKNKQAQQKERKAEIENLENLIKELKNKSKSIQSEVQSAEGNLIAARSTYKNCEQELNDNNDESQKPQLESKLQEAKKIFESAQRRAFILSLDSLSIKHQLEGANEKKTALTMFVSKRLDPKEEEQAKFRYQMALLLEFRAGVFKQYVENLKEHYLQASDVNLSDVLHQEVTREKLDVVCQQNLDKIQQISEKEYAQGNIRSNTWLQSAFKSGVGSFSKEIYRAAVGKHILTDEQEREITYPYGYKERVQVAEVAEEVEESPRLNIFNVQVAQQPEVNLTDENDLSLPENIEDLPTPSTLSTPSSSLLSFDFTRYAEERRASMDSDVSSSVDLSSPSEKSPKQQSLAKQLAEEAAKRKKEEKANKDSKYARLQVDIPENEDENLKLSEEESEIDSPSVLSSPASSESLSPTSSVSSVSTSPESSFAIGKTLFTVNSGQPEPQPLSPTSSESSVSTDATESPRSAASSVATESREPHSPASTTDFSSRSSRRFSFSSHGSADTWPSSIVSDSSSEAFPRTPERSRRVLITPALRKQKDSSAKLAMSSIDKLKTKLESFEFIEKVNKTDAPNILEVIHKPQKREPENNKTNPYYIQERDGAQNFSADENNVNPNTIAAMVKTAITLVENDVMNFDIDKNLPEPMQAHLRSAFINEAKEQHKIDKVTIDGQLISRPSPRVGL